MTATSVSVGDLLDWNALWSLEDRAVLLAHLMRVEHETMGYVQMGVIVKVFDESGQALLFVHPDHVDGPGQERLVNFSTRAERGPHPGIRQSLAAKRG